MRVLEFIATGQKLRRDPDCDFTGIVAGSRGYLRARFHFSHEWSGCKKVAVFTCRGKDYPVGLRDNMCEIPAEALAASAVQVYVIGRRPGYEITTTVTAFPQTVRRVVTQLRAMVTQQTTNVEAVGAAQVAAVKAQGTASTQEAVEAIQAQGAATLATIPAEYTELEATVDRLTRDRAAAIVCQAEGELLQITDASNDPLQGLRIFGRTLQHKTTGAQLIPYPYFNGNKTYNGVTWTTNPDGSVSARGTATATSPLYFTNSAHELAPGQYTISGSTNGVTVRIDSTIRETGKWKDGVAISKNGQPVTFTITEEDAAAYFYTIYASVEGGSTADATIYPMLNAGPSALPWEPYSNGLASPSPAWPQELQSVQGPVVRVYGANLFDASKFNGKTQGGATLTNNGDGSLTVSGSGALTEIFSSLYSDTVLPNLLRPGKLTLATGAATVPVFHLYAIDGNGQRIFTLNNGQSVDVTQEMIDAMTKVQFVCYAAAGVEITPGTIKPMLYQTGDGTWSAYKEPQALTITTPGSLPGIPVASGGNYTDENGQQWIADEVDLARGVYVQRIGSATYNGDSEEYIATYGLTGTAFGISRKSDDYQPPATSDTLQPALCDKLTVTSTGDIYTNGNNATFAFSVSGNVIRFSLDALYGFTTDDVRAWLADNPLTFIYILANPVETPLTDVELQAYLALHSNKPTTTVLNDAGAHMVLEYAADPKTYIDNKLAALVAANN